MPRGTVCFVCDDSDGFQVLVGRDRFPKWLGPIPRSGHRGRPTEASASGWHAGFRLLKFPRDGRFRDPRAVPFAHDRVFGFAGCSRLHAMLPGLCARSSRRRWIPDGVPEARTRAILPGRSDVVEALWSRNGRALIFREGGARVAWAGRSPPGLRPSATEDDLRATSSCFGRNGMTPDHQIRGDSDEREGNRMFREVRCSPCGRLNRRHK